MFKTKTIVLSIIIIVGLSFFLASFSDKSHPSDSFSPKGFLENYAIYPVEHPEKITFAGEEMPLNNFDTYESFDRELLVNTYWQSQTVLFLKRANRYFPIIEPILKKYNVPDDFKYLALAESGLANVTSPSGARGFWQIMEGTAGDYDLEVNDEVDERYHLEKSTTLAAKYLKKSYKKYNNWTLAAASYNMGRRSISKQIMRQKASSYYDLVLGNETGRYVYRIAAIKTIMENPEKYGFYVADKYKYDVLKYTIVKVDSTVSNLADFAHSQGVNYKVLKELNPWLRSDVLTNKTRKVYEIKIAKNNSRTFLPNPDFFAGDSLLPTK